MIKVLSTNKILEFEKGPIRRSLFSNGAVSLFHRQKSMQSACVNLYFLAGSCQELPHQEGIVHVIEHMLFKEGKDSNIVKELEFKGASINAYTYKEYVCFEMECSASKLPLFLSPFLELFFNAVFLASDLELEKQVIIQELRDELDDHESMGHELIMQRSLNRKLGHPIIGTEKTIKSFSAKDLSQFYKKFFSSDKMLLSITSGEEFKNLENIFLKSMQKINRFNVVKKPVRIKPRDRYFWPKGFKSTLKRKTENAIYYLATGGPSLESKNFFDLAIIDDLLFEGLSSKYYLELREKRGLLYGLGSALSSFADTGIYVMIFNGHKKSMPEIKKRVFATLEYYAKFGFDPKEVEAIKERMIEATLCGFDDMLERNEFAAMRELYGYKNFSLEYDLENIRNVDAKRLQYLLKKILAKPKIEVTILPKESI